MKRLAIIALAFAASLCAADYSGTWNGAGGMVDAKYGSVPVTAQITLLQAGGSLQGTLKEGNGKPMAISSGSVSGSSLVFALGNGKITAKLTATGSQLIGKMTSSSGQIVNIVFTKQP